jgi:hypothetical protein
MMKQLEELAVTQYKKFVPEMNITQKQKFLDEILSQQDYSSKELSGAVQNLVKLATKDSKLDTLILQGFSLELLGQSIYRAILNTTTLDESSHQLAQQGNTASQQILNQVISILKRENAVGESLFKSFISATHDVFGQLDGMASLIDETFTSQSTVKFDDVLADAVTELLKYGIDLGMDRKKLLRQLTSSLMAG